MAKFQKGKGGRNEGKGGNRGGRDGKPGGKGDRNNQRDGGR